MKRLLKASCAILAFAVIAGGERVKLDAKLEAKIETKWTTVSRTVPVWDSSPNAMLYYGGTDHQVGVTSSNTYAHIEWKGRDVTVLLESVKIKRSTRDVPQSNEILTTNSILQ